MKAAVGISVTRRGDPSPHMLAVAEGLRRCGVEVVEHHGVPNGAADICVTWGTRRADVARAAGFKGPFLIVEHGYLGDRINTWTSLGWNGLNGRAKFPDPQDEGQRFWKNFGHLACEWEKFDGYWLVAGQIVGDQSLANVNYFEWLRGVLDDLGRMGVDYRFRQHPEAVRRGHELPLSPKVLSTGSLAEDFSEAACVVAFNSNATVDAVLAGIPAVTYDEGAMAWSVTSHSVRQPIVMPERNEWFRRMAWTQWTMDELSDGTAWEVVREAMPCLPG